MCAEGGKNQVSYRSAPKSLTLRCVTSATRAIHNRFVRIRTDRAIFSTSPSIGDGENSLREPGLLDTIHSAAGEALAVNSRPQLNDRLQPRILRSNMTEIVAIRAREVLDSRGNPTVEADVILESGEMGRAIVPSGASTGEHEAVELRDGDKSHYMGKGVLQAVANVETVIAPELEGIDTADQGFVDQSMIALDGIAEQGKAGSERHSGSIAGQGRPGSRIRLRLPLYRYLGGDKARVTLPVPLMNVLNGGKHADDNVDFQEFMIVPLGAYLLFIEALRHRSKRRFHSLKKILGKKGYNTAVGDEGGFAPPA